MNDQKLHEVDFNIDQADDKLVIAKQQLITDEYIQSLKDERFDNKSGRAGEYHRAASIPTVVVEKWMREGYNVFEEPVAKSIAKLKAEGLDYFITSDKV